MFLVERRSLLVAGIGLTLVLSACSSSGNSGTSGPSSGSTGTGSSSAAASGGDAGLQQATAYLAQYEKTPTKIDQTVKPTKLPTGQKWDYGSCGLASCQIVGTGFTSGAAALGATVKTINQGITPATVSAAWDQMVQDRPDVAATGGTPAQLISRQIQQLSTNGSKVFTWASADKPAAISGLTANTAPSDKLYAGGGKIAAAYVTVHTSGKGKAVVMYGSDIGGQKDFFTSYQKTIQQWCSGCAVAALPITQGDIGTKAPGQLVSYLQQHPDTNYVVSAFGGPLTGVPAALQGAGITSAKLLSFAGTPTDLQNVNAGQIEADIGQSLPMYGWIMAYNIALTLAGQQLSGRTDGLTTPVQILTKGNFKVNSGGQWIGVQGYEQQFTTLFKG
jgi:ribose transport system substrate-binding protein